MDCYFSNYYLWLKISKLGEESNISLIISFVFILIGVNIFRFLFWDGGGF